MPNSQKLPIDAEDWICLENDELTGDDEITELPYGLRVIVEIEKLFHR